MGQPPLGPGWRRGVAKQAATELFTTSITEAEIFYGIELLSKGKRRESLRAAAEAMFCGRFCRPYIRVRERGGASLLPHWLLPPPRAGQAHQPRGCADRSHRPGTAGQTRDAECCGFRRLWGRTCRPVECASLASFVSRMASGRSAPLGHSRFSDKRVPPCGGQKEQTNYEAKEHDLPLVRQGRRRRRRASTPPPFPTAR